MSQDRTAFMLECAFDGAVPARPVWLDSYDVSVVPHPYPITKRPDTEDLCFACRSCEARFRLPVFARVEGDLWTGLETHAASHAAAPPVPAAPAAEPSAVS